MNDLDTRNLRQLRVGYCRRRRENQGVSARTTDHRIVGDLYAGSEQESVIVIATIKRGYAYGVSNQRIVACFTK